MKRYTYYLLLLFSGCLNLDVRGQGSHDPSRAARQLIAEIDQGVTAEQYRHLKIEAFKAHVELQMTRLKARHALEAERNKIEQAISLQEERVALLEELTARTREDLMHLATERAELESQANQRDEGHGGFEGSWYGRDPDGQVIRLTIQGDHARVEVESGNEWFETEFHAEPRDDGRWNVALRVLECSQGDYAGKTSLGLAELSDGHLTMALAEPGRGGRPTSLEAGSQEAKVVRLERQ